MHAYRVCSRCEKLEFIGEKKVLEDETERVFVHWQASSVVDEHGKEDDAGTVFEGRTVDIWVSLEDPSLCLTCEMEEYHEHEKGR